MSLLDDYISFMSAPAPDRQDRFAALLGQLKAAQREGRQDEVVAILPRLVQPWLDYTSATRLLQIYRRIGPVQGGQPLRLAILGGFTTHQLRDLIELFLRAGGIQPEIYESDYGVFRQEILLDQSPLYQFRPQAIFLASSWRDLGRRPGLGDTAQAVAGLVEAELADWAQLWSLAHGRLGCQILQNNFDSPPWRILGNHEPRCPGSFGRFIAAVNQALHEQAPPYVIVHDLEALAAGAGRWAWCDERFFLQAKIACAPEHLVSYAHSVSSLLLTQAGRTRKCLVLDLDNTLWGGVIGDDGLAGIRLGQGEPEGEGFLAFQRYLQALRQRGVLLAVCSKNTDAVAREVFEKHPEMVLRMEDIACFVANWDDKPANLRTIALRLNIGLDSLVFVDDNPAERAIVRQMLPQVEVPEVGCDPLDFIRVLEQHRYFQVVGLGQEDLRRTEYYTANAQREALQSSSGDIEQYLRRLEMVATVSPIHEGNLDRSAQLINRSNQFNLTTRRRGAAELMTLARDPSWVTVTISLADRFGDNGLISVLLARAQEGELCVDTWLMSCRVLQRGVEDLALNLLARQARHMGLDRIRGQFIPSPKNALVRDHYARLGFQPLPGDENGATSWVLPLSGWDPRTHCITERTSHE